MAGRAASIRSRLMRLAASALLVCAPLPASAQPSEVAVKAAFLQKFGGYVAWPASARPNGGQPFTLCLIGEDPFGRLIDGAVRGQQVGGHPVQVRRLEGVAGADGCQLAFVHGSGTAGMLQALQSKPILTVTDARSGSPQGMIHFVVHQGRVRFHIDEAAATRSGLSINSRLLGIALSVKRGR